MAKQTSVKQAQEEQAQPRQLQVVQVDGNIYLGVLENKQLADAYQLHGAKDMGSTVGRMMIADFFVKRNEGELLTLNFESAGVAVASRMLNDDEAAMFQQCSMTMERASRIAIKRLVSAEFSRLLGK